MSEKISRRDLMKRSVRAGLVVGGIAAFKKMHGMLVEWEQQMKMNPRGFLV